MLHPHNGSKHLCILSLLLLLQASPLLAAPAQEYTKYVPEALPPDAWLNKSTVNYNVTHEKYAELLVCIWVPFGTFGFFYWFTAIFISVGSILTTHTERDREDKSWGGFMQSFLAVGWSMFTSYQDMQTLRSCSTHPEFEVIRKVTYAFLMAASVSGFSGIFLAFWEAGRSKAIYNLYFFLVWIGVFLQGVCGFLVVKVVLRLQDPGNRIGVLVEMVSISAKAPVCLLCVLIAILAIALGIIVAQRRDDKIVRVGVGCTLLGLFFGASVGVAGLSYVYLGNVIGSPWGMYYVKNFFGQATMSLSFLVSFIELLVLGFISFNNWS